MEDYTQEEQSLVLRYLNGDLTEVQFNFWVNQKGLDRQKLDVLIENARTASRLMLTFAARFVLFLIVVATIFFLFLLCR